jgi:hypothetical protein
MPSFVHSNVFAASVVCLPVVYGIYCDELNDAYMATVHGLLWIWRVCAPVAWLLVDAIDVLVFRKFRMVRMPISLVPWYFY